MIRAMFLAVAVAAIAPPAGAADEERSTNVTIKVGFV